MQSAGNEQHRYISLLMASMSCTLLGANLIFRLILQVNALAGLYSKLLGVELNAHTDVLVTVGAYLSLYYAFTGWVNRGDEVIGKCFSCVYFFCSLKINLVKFTLFSELLSLVFPQLKLSFRKEREEQNKFV